MRIGELAAAVGVARAARPTHGTGGGQAQVFGYARGQGPVTAGLVSVCVIQTLTMSVLLRNWPAAHAVMLSLGVLTIVFVVVRHAACALRPHLLTADTLRIRQAAHADLSVPLGAIASVRRETRTTRTTRTTTHERTGGELDLPVRSLTSLTLELTTPVTHVTLLGRRRAVRVIRFHAEDAERLAHTLSTLARSATEGETPCLCCCPRPKARLPQAVAPR
ncbi:hypothetical protein [Streptomyces carpinensis]|uniref:Integral membrane protein n=1 Tax=Streptomyces carpinensis TaxID=66369 RepID=A0ABV1WJ56_9ACTN|nr:hypothetical protein [Streptomyces carpinensis]